MPCRTYIKTSFLFASLPVFRSSSARPLHGRRPLRSSIPLRRGGPNCDLGARRGRDSDACCVPGAPPLPDSPTAPSRSPTGRGGTGRGEGIAGERFCGSGRRIRLTAGEGGVGKRGTSGLEKRAYHRQWAGLVQDRVPDRSGTVVQERPRGAAAQRGQDSAHHLNPRQPRRQTARRGWSTALHSPLPKRENKRKRVAPGICCSALAKQDAPPTRAPLKGPSKAGTRSGGNKTRAP